MGPIDAVNARLVAGKAPRAGGCGARRKATCWGGVIRVAPTAPDPRSRPASREPERSAQCRGGVAELNVRGRWLAELPTPPVRAPHPADQPAAQAAGGLAGGGAGVWMGWGGAGVMADIGPPIRDRRPPAGPGGNRTGRPFPSAGFPTVQCGPEPVWRPGAGAGPHADMDTLPPPRGASTVRANWDRCAKPPHMKHPRVALTRRAGRFAGGAPCGSCNGRGRTDRRGYTNPYPPRGQSRTDEPPRRKSVEVGPSSTRPSGTNCAQRRGRHGARREQRPSDHRPVRERPRTVMVDLGFPWRRKDETSARSRSPCR